MNQDCASAYGSVKAAGHNPHPTVKSLKLFSYLITLGSRAGDIVCDPYCGSGTSCVAANMLGRKYIGIDLDPETCLVAEARILGNMGLLAEMMEDK